MLHFQVDVAGCQWRVAYEQSWHTVAFAPSLSSIDMDVPGAHYTSL